MRPHAVVILALILVATNTANYRPYLLVRNLGDLLCEEMCSRHPRS